MNLETSRIKIAQAITLLRQGNPHAADDALSPLIFEGGMIGDCAAKAVNWIGLGFPQLARTELEGFLRKTALSKSLEVAK